MIQAVTTAQHCAQFLAAAEMQLATRAQLGARLALFGDLPGSGWQFYTAVPDEQDMQEGANLPATPAAQALLLPDATQALPPLAIALRGASATVAGEYDPEELGTFCRFLGVDCITTPCTQPPQGYAHHQTLTVYALEAGKQLSLPALKGSFAGQQGDFTLDRNPSISALVPLLFADEDADLQDRYYADGCTARNAGMAEFWLLHHQNKAVFTVAASAIVGQDVYLSAGETIESYRGQGIGGHYIAKMANEYAAKGYQVCFVCEPVRCHFYTRLGFTQSGLLHQYTPEKT